MSTATKNALTERATMAKWLQSLQDFMLTVEYAELTQVRKDLLQERQALMIRYLQNLDTWISIVGGESGGGEAGPGEDDSSGDDD